MADVSADASSETIERRGDAREISDAQLLHAYVVDAFRPAFAEIVRRHGPMVLGVCRRVLRNSTDADDAFQATFLVLAMNAKSIRKGASLPDWLFGVALRSARKLKAADARRRAQLEQYMHNVTRQNVDRGAAATDLADLLDEQITRLPERYRKPIVLCHLKGLTKREAAAALDWPEGTVATRLGKARELLQERLAEQGITAPAEALAADALAVAVPAMLSVETLKSTALLGTSAAASTKSIVLAKGVCKAMRYTLTKVLLASLVIFLIGGIVATAVVAKPNGQSVPPAATSAPAKTLFVAELPPMLPTTPVPAIPADVTAEKLITEVRNSEAWIEHVQSFSVRFSSVWTKSAEGVELERANLKKQFPRLTIDEKQFPDLMPDKTDTMELDFDTHRLHSRNVLKGQHEMLSIFDGQHAYSYSRYDRPSKVQEGYGIGNTAYSVGMSMHGAMSWPLAGYHQFFWDDPKDAHPGIFAPVTDYEIVGREKYRGVDCWALNETGFNAHFLYVGVADHLLHGLTDGVMRGNPQEDSIVKAFATEHGQNITTSKDLFKWFGTLPRDEHNRLAKAYLARVHRVARPFIEHWMLDYKEVKPGCFFPMKQGYNIFNAEYDKPFIKAHREMTFTEVHVDEPLADDLFKLPMHDGVQVVDRSSDLVLIYKYKSNMTAEEWDKIKAEGWKRKQDEVGRQKAQDLAVGKSAPEFPKDGHWLNTTSNLGWNDFAGKPVIVDFWAEWCGPCMNDLPALVRLHKDRGTNGFAVIGIHTPGSAPEKIQKAMKDFEMTYPVFVDVPPPPGKPMFGTLYSQFGVSAIPHVFLIDAKGQVVLHGTLGEVVQKARELVAKNNAAS